MQLVGVNLVLSGLIMPTVATYRHAPRNQLAPCYALAIGGHVAGLALSVITDLPSSPVIVRMMAGLGLLLHLSGRHVGRI